MTYKPPNHANITKAIFTSLEFSMSKLPKLKHRGILGDKKSPTTRCPAAVRSHFKPCSVIVSW
eukprot:c41893_g1_i1 orf=276-464(-)